MKKTIKMMVAIALGAVAAVAMLSSCNTTKKVPSQEEIETKIVGKWKVVSIDGVTLLTNDRAVNTYYADKTETCSMSKFWGDLGTYAWDNKIPYTWSSEGNVLCSKPVGAVGVTRYNKVVEIDDNRCALITTKIIDQQSGEHTFNWNSVFQKITVDYSQDIIGMWESVDMTGYETYGNIEARIDYKTDGTYTYYKKVDGEWQPLADVTDEWNVDGDWLATRWQNNGSDVMNYEWWDIDYIKGDEMKWSALREKDDGTRFTTTFTWKKVK